MPRRSAFSKTHRFFEVLALIVLLTPLTASDWRLLVPQGVAGLALVFALAHRAARHWAWLATAAAGLIFLLLLPASVEGILLVLLAAFLLFDSRWPGRWMVPAVFALVGLVLAAQIGSLLLYPGLWGETLARCLLTDALVVLLAVIFQKDLFFAALAEKPDLSLAEFGLTARESQIIHLVWGGETPKEIACFLGLTDGAVRMQLSRIYGKLQIPGLKELSQLVLTHRILWDEESASNSALKVRRRKGVRPRG